MCHYLVATYMAARLDNVCPVVEKWRVCVCLWSDRSFVGGREADCWYCISHPFAFGQSALRVT